MTTQSPNFRNCSLDEETSVWYREAGSQHDPTILLLHGYPTSSNMFRNLIPLIASKFHVVAPDFPGFGFTTVSPDFDYTFENIAKTIDSFVKKIGLSKYLLYIFDYGSPVGFRLALMNPNSVIFLVVQNGNAYEEGLDDRFWAPLRDYWGKDQQDPQMLKALKGFVEDPKNIKSQYYDGVPRPETVDPTGCTLDIALLKRPNQSTVQVKLFHDYQTNVAMYPKFQEFLRTHSIPILVVWGTNDSIFTLAGAKAYARDASDVILRLYDTGHFALETHCDEIAREILEVFASQE
ncbi:LADA_0E12552g1_1 [Lachancea dasiensis]|uniref:LADA_0E12552g1_1 n=1 Tax=Lachancea dasiensis TaxID=1072105 RepID=A0A1G4JFW9_9SACH|nr:LADA_0E12552g1_1 [Lachancea dasiensis]